MAVFNITQIVDRLVGQVEWAGETNADKKSLESLSEIEYLVEHLVEQLVYNMDALKSHPGNLSAEELGAKSKDILLYLKSEIERVGL